MKCAVCQSEHHRILFNKNNYDVYQCENCKLIFANPEIESGNEEKFVKNIYRSGYFDGHAPSPEFEPGYSVNYIEDKRDEILLNAKRHLKNIEKRHPEKGQLLDVGCAAGFFLKVARDNGWSVTGVEISPEIAGYGQSGLNLEIHTGTFENVTLPEKKFDVITAWDVIEHVVVPDKFLARANSLLKDGGLLVLGTPNADSLAFKWRQKNWHHLRPPEHLFYYSPANLKMLLEKFFESADVHPAYPSYSKIPFTIKAYFRRFLYTGFNHLAKIIRKDEYLIAYAAKE